MCLCERAQLLHELSASKIVTSGTAIFAGHLGQVGPKTGDIVEFGLSSTFHLQDTLP